MKAKYETAFPAYDNGSFYVRIGSFLSRSEAETFLKKGSCPQLLAADQVIPSQ